MPNIDYILADENIADIHHYFGQDNSKIILKPGREITRNDLLAHQIEILLVRSVTKINSALLYDTAVKFVGSTVSGIDHLDISFLEKNHIAWSAATGCNRTAVIEYILSVMAVLQKKDLLRAKKPRIAVIGVGQIGRGVVAAYTALGYEVLQCDPLRAEKERDFPHTPIEKLHDLDCISLHLPLTYTGNYPTYHLIEKIFLMRQKAGCILINTSRGEVIYTADLKEHGKHLVWCFDVWENEPTIDVSVVEKAFIATPHIAGYSIQSKRRGTYQIYEAAMQKKIIMGKKLPCLPYPRKAIFFGHEKASREACILAMYNPLDTTLQMKQALFEKKSNNPGWIFDKLRKNFTDRSEFEFIRFYP